MNDVTFTFLQIKFKVSFWFVAVITLYAILFDNSLRVFLAIILHEAAHILVIYLSGRTLTSVTFRIGDIRIVSDLNDSSKPERLLISLSGPAANLAACCASYLSGDNVFFGINLALAVFQLLPCRGSDGGEIVQVIFGEKGDRVLTFISAFSALAVLTGAVALLQQGKGNLSLVVAAFYIIFMSCK